MQQLTKAQLFFRDFMTTIQNYRNVIPFIKKHELWKGIGQYGWATNFMMIIGALLGLKLFGLFGDWYNSVATQGFSLSAMSTLFSQVSTEGYELFVAGGFKYVILIVLEIVIFHFARGTLERLTGDKLESDFNAFWEAQIRMIKVTFYCFVMETIVSAIAKFGLGLIDFRFIEPLIIIIIQCYFLGFAVIDNYNEIYKISIKESAKYTQIYSGVALGIGLVVYVLMLLPVLGTVLAPLLGAVVATITMHELEQKDHKMNLAIENSEEY